MMRFKKQSTETRDFDVNFEDWFSNRVDGPESIEFVTPDGITEVSNVLVGFVGKVILSGGTNGESYTITARLTTTAGLIKETEFVVTIKDIG